MKYNKQQYKERHQLPAPEEISVIEPLAITLNINDTSNTLTLHPRYQALLQRISQYADVDVYYEYSKSFKLHVHGTLRLKYNNILPLYALLNDEQVKNNFTYCIKILFNNNEETQVHTTWHEYCIKQKHLSKPYLKELNINYHTVINKHKPIEQIYKYITLHDELKDSLD